jgi:hypothetical protein
MRLLYSILLLVFVAPVFAQQNIRVLHSGQSRLSVRIGNKLYKNEWTVTPQKRPDVLQLPVLNKQLPVCFIAENDSLLFYVEAGSSYDFVILVNGNDSAFTRITGIKHEPAARFNKAYQQAHDKITLVEIPKVYELVNIIIALTPTAQGDSDLVYHQSPYYQQVQQWFKPFIREPIVLKIDSVLKSGQYAEIKMDAYAFDYAAHDRIVQSKIYDRISWGPENTLRPYIADLESFARKSKFNTFYKQHESLYKAQTRCYEDSINTTAMIQWLRGNFPKTGYNSFKVIFSPLVYGSQSANWFESNGFKEMQMHINFPYDTPAMVKMWSTAAVTLRRSQTVFTEMNHSFINPQLDLNLSKGNDDFAQAFEHLEIWTDTAKPARHYQSPRQCFNEYMNWALVSLYYADKAPNSEKERLIKSVSEQIQNVRGFKKFIAFNDYLVQLYITRPSGTTLADLYPRIIQWFNLNKGF